MPSSRPNHIPLVISVVRQLDPESILDVGIGFGKWGHLFREYTDIVKSEAEPARYARENWRVRIDGIEGYEPYVTPMHYYLYNQIIIGNMSEKIKDIGTYDVVFIGDVLEHVDRLTGCRLLEDCLRHAKKAVIVSTPTKETQQKSLCSNDLEVHQSLWDANDFHSIGFCLTSFVENDILVVVFIKEGVQHPICLSVLPEEKRPFRTIWGQLKSIFG